MGLEDELSPTTSSFAKRFFCCETHKLLKSGLRSRSNSSVCPLFPRPLIDATLTLLSSSFFPPTHNFCSPVTVRENCRRRQRGRERANRNRGRRLRKRRYYREAHTSLGFPYTRSNRNRKRWREKSAFYGLPPFSKAGVENRKPYRKKEERRTYKKKEGEKNGLDFDGGGGV